MNKIIIWLLKIYKTFFSPIGRVLFGSACRFNPSCSSFATEAVERYGILIGGKLAILRFLRCHSYNNSSYFDPVPNL
ncbi:membrane protein insertion efficiency factor YidD [Candidatus Woesebacteria bacterium RBG_16_40_11]|uniref:Putative membrane protein insertion efficiency factor n=1 Tax=Candidatus Woesebacteria bacterium RIFCSPHIGHO2_01_FULL_40_22 TaxID=1802499 RepID=A0A1F7YFU2_9BACT|nr:MAG: membrane protein insertion efficiency factor YidD [Candidatus Woesebacteria bacterium RBG_16_40_11]OGM26201.1 MAG: membrane protein insertion efficiency factor YidD [Candidatus Woesebacteria bacterium RIFCSPHIGHO2_01_FULL_40_22]